MVSGSVDRGIAGSKRVRSPTVTTGDCNGNGSSTNAPPDDAGRRWSGVRGRQVAGRGDDSGQDDYADEQGYEQEVPPAPPPPAPTSGESQADEIQRLAELHTAGALTDEEFAAAKAKALGI